MRIYSFWYMTPCGMGTPVFWLKRTAFIFRAQEEGILSLDYSKDGGSKLYRNIGTYIPIYTVPSEGKEIFRNYFSIKHLSTDICKRNAAFSVK